MSDEDEYSSSDDESSLAEEFITSSNKLSSKLNASKSGNGVLTLEDNDDDESEFQRPDLAPVYAEDDGEEEEDGENEPSDDEIEGEYETAESTPKGKKLSGKKTTATRTGTKAKAGAKKSSYDEDSKKNNKKKKKKPIGICMMATKYECVRRVAKKLAFKELEENEDWSLFWTDTSVSIDRVNQMKKWQVTLTSTFFNNQ